MKKIKLTSKLNLNKTTISELTNQEEIKGGRTGTGCPTQTNAKGCVSSPVCCLSHTCPTNNGICAPDEEVLSF